jgi:predicted lipase
VKKADLFRLCDCFKLLDRQERGVSLTYLDGEDSLHTGICKLKRDNGNEIIYKYQRGHILEIIERFPGGY